MNGFRLLLHQATGNEQITGVTSFVGEDASGCFGIRSGHARFMTALVTGLARFRVDQQQWQYLAMPGAIIRFEDDRLVLSTRHYLRGDDYLRISQALHQQLLTEEQTLLATRKSLHRMEQQVLERLWELARRRAP
jgi:F-type H+-transporting ATPase subunit epsilon